MPQGDPAGELADRFAEWVCKKPALALNVEFSGKVAVMFGVQGKLQLGISSHGQLFATAAGGGSMGLQGGADVGVSAGLSLLGSDYPVGLGPTQGSVTVYADHVLGLGGGGDISFDLDGSEFGMSVSGGPRAGVFYGVGASVHPSRTIASLYDGDSLVGEYGTLNYRYVHGDRVDEPLVQYTGGDLTIRRHLFADHQGSIIAHSDTAGNVTQKNAYDPYGIPDLDNAGRFGYTGQSWLKELGLNYYKARIYSPRLGRFLQTDPIFYKDDMNLYAYVGNDAINKRDPSGTHSCASMSESQCSTFKAAQESTKKQLGNGLASLNGIAAKLKSGEKLSDGQQRFADRVSNVLGKGAGTDAKVIDALIGVGNNMMASLNSKDPANFGGESPMGRIAEIRGSELTLFSGFFRLNSRSMVQVIGHEAGHHGGRLMDIGLRYGDQEISAYGYGNAVRQAELLRNPSRMLMRTDPTVYALGFEDGD